MADNEILAAINDVGKSVVAMEKQLKNCCTKDDLARMSKEISNNSQRIDKLFKMRENDGSLLVERVEKIVDQHIAAKKITPGGTMSLSPAEESYKQAYLVSRRSVRLWPIPSNQNLEEQVRQFFYTVLSVPDEVAKTVRIDSVQRLAQPRRSKVSKEVLIRFSTATDRDTIQSYAVNLAGIEGKAGLRLDVPEHLRGIFRQFEEHAALLRQKYGKIKRSIKFEDVGQTFCMDVKLPSTGWHRLSYEELRSAQSKIKRPVGQESNSSLSTDAAEKKLILMCEDNDPEEDPVIIESDEEEPGE